MTKIFGNKYRAELVENDWDHTKIARLYSPDDIFLASAHCDERSFSLISEALLDGYFAGWRDCKCQVTKRMLTAVNIEPGNFDN